MLPGEGRRDVFSVLSQHGRALCVAYGRAYGDDSGTVRRGDKHGQSVRAPFDQPVPPPVNIAHVVAGTGTFDVANTVALAGTNRDYPGAVGGGSAYGAPDDCAECESVVSSF